jgi:hypothetical protein
VQLCVCFLGLFDLCWCFGPFACSDLCVAVSLIATCVFLASSVYVCVCVCPGTLLCGL